MLLLTLYFYPFVRVLAPHLSPFVTQTKLLDVTSDMRMQWECSCMLFTASNERIKFIEKKRILGQITSRFVEVCLSSSHSCCMAFWAHFIRMNLIFAAIERAQKGLFLSDNYHTPLLFFHLFYSYFILMTNIELNIALGFYINHKVKTIF